MPPATDSDRTWPLPSRSHAMRMKWLDLLFAHWPIAKEDLARHLPDGLEVDTFAGKAWIGIVPFRMTDVAPRWVPAIPGLSAFPELNVRTYVTIDGKPGVWFFSLDATSWFAVRVARAAFHLKYMDAKMSLQKKEDSWIEYRSRRTHRNEPAASFVGRYRPVGDEFFAQSGSLEHWLTARYCLYVADRKGRVLRGEIDHPPWPLQKAELQLEENSMLDGPHLVIAESQPHLLFSREVAVRAWTNQRIAAF